MEHDTEAHAELIRLSKDPRSVCGVSGYSLLALKKVGEELTVDRVNPRLGYVVGNIRLLARGLNNAKGVGREVPRGAVLKLRWKVQRIRKDKWTREVG